MRSSEFNSARMVVSGLLSKSRSLGSVWSLSWSNRGTNQVIDELLGRCNLKGLCPRPVVVFSAVMYPASISEFRTSFGRLFSGKRTP